MLNPLGLLLLWQGSTSTCYNAITVNPLSGGTCSGTPSSSGPERSAAGHHARLDGAFEGCRGEPVATSCGWAYHPVEGSYGAFGSCRRPRPLPASTRRCGAVGEEVADTSTDWLGAPLERSIPLPLHRLAFAGRRRARSGISVGELLSKGSLRPDLLRIRTIYEGGHSGEASLALGRLLAEEDGAPYQLLDEIPGDRTFAFSVEELEYVDRMATYLFLRGPRGPPRFVLPEITGLYVSPRPRAQSKARVALQKSACALMRIHQIALAPTDWSAYRHRDEEDGRVEFLRPHADRHATNDTCDIQKSKMLSASSRATVVFNVYTCHFCTQAYSTIPPEQVWFSTCTRVKSGHGCTLQYILSMFHFLRLTRV